MIREEYENKTVVRRRPVAIARSKSSERDETSALLSKQRRHACIIDNLTWPRYVSRPLPSVPKSPLEPLPHMSIGVWLTTLDLHHLYADTFANFANVEHLLGHSEADIRHLGVNNSEHLARIVSSLSVLRNKSNTSLSFPNVTEGGDKKASASRHSVAVTVTTPLDNDQQVNNSQDTGAVSVSNAMDECTELRLALEWELGLDARDLRSHAWYHGTIARQHAEELVTRDGDFLVRDCSSQPGNYVLTCRAKHLPQPLHFVINKLTIQPDTVYERVQFTFEDDLYDTVADLITFYVGSGKPISAASGARIQYPRNRLYPLSLYATGPPPRPRLPSKKQRSHSLTPAEMQRTATAGAAPPPHSADGVILMSRSAGADTLRFSTHSLPRRITATELDTSSSPSSSPSPSPSPLPPPKPSRVPSLPPPEHGCLQRLASYHASGSDSGNGSGDSAQSSAAGDAIESTGHKAPPGVVIKNPRYNLATSDSTATLKSLDYDYVAAEHALMQLEQPQLYLNSRFDLENFHTLLLPALENKPLDSAALRSVKMTLQENAARVLANHLTRVDLDVILGGNDGGSGDRLSSLSAIELCGLPHGHQLRQDLIERTECLKLLVAVTVLTCSSEEERAETLHKWIEVAADTKTALGNLFGFCALMLGLCTPAVLGLGRAWHVLRQRHTDSAFYFESKLRPTLRHMHDAASPIAPNTTIPHLLPLVLLHERTLQDTIGSPQHDAGTLTASCLCSWEVHAQDFGLSTLLAHMQAARKFSDSVSIYRRNAEIVFGECARTEELILDTFRTEFHMKFLWGSRGALASAHDRHAKFEQIVTLMADKCCQQSQDAINNGTGNGTGTDTPV